MRWDDLLGDLGLQLEAAERAERDAEVATDLRVEVARQPVLERLRALDAAASVGVDVGGHARLVGRVLRAGPGWVLLAEEPGPGRAVVALDAVVALSGLPRRAAPVAAGASSARFGLAAALRVVARDRAAVRVLRRDGSVLPGTLDRVGLDWVDVAVHAQGEPSRRARPDDVVTVPLAALSAVRT